MLSSPTSLRKAYSGWTAVYSVTPVGRLINIKIDGYVPDTEYEDLRTSLEKHYQGDIRVNEVYVTKLGTIVVDCRH